MEQKVEQVRIRELKPFYVVMVKFKGSNQFQWALGKQVSTDLTHAEVEAEHMAKTITKGETAAIFEINNTGCKQVGDIYEY